MQSQRPATSQVRPAQPTARSLGAQRRLQDLRRPGGRRRRRLLDQAAGRSSRSSGPTAPARPPSSTCSPGSTSRASAGSASRARTSPARGPDIITSMGVARTFQNIRLFSTMSAVENVMVGPARAHEGRAVRLDPAHARRAPRGGGGAREGARDARLRRACARPSSTRSRSTSPTATSGGWRSPARWPATPRCCCSTSPPPA